jgi:Domain of unknown function (DUF4328)
MSISIFDPRPEQLATRSEVAPALAAALRWGRVTVVGLLAQLVVLAAAMASSLACLGLLFLMAGGARFTKASVAVLLGAIRVTSLLNLLLFVATGIVWLVWLYQSYGSLNHLGTRRTQHWPGRAVVVWFIPVVSLIEPYRIVRELWLRSAGLNVAEPDPGERTPLVTWWWALFVTTGLVDLMKSAPGLLGIRGAAATFEVLLASQILRAGAAVLAILLVRRIASLQRRALDQLDAVAA